MLTYFTDRNRTRLLLLYHYHFSSCLQSFSRFLFPFAVTIQYGLRLATSFSYSNLILMVFSDIFHLLFIYAIPAGVLLIPPLLLVCFLTSFVASTSAFISCISRTCTVGWSKKVFGKFSQIKQRENGLESQSKYRPIPEFFYVSRGFAVGRSTT